MTTLHFRRGKNQKERNAVRRGVDEKPTKAASSIHLFKGGPTPMGIIKGTITKSVKRAKITLAERA